jgi:hypothetical protein
LKRSEIGSLAWNIGGHPHEYKRKRKPGLCSNILLQSLRTGRVILDAHRTLDRQSTHLEAASTLTS